MQRIPGRYFPHMVTLEVQTGYDDGGTPTYQTAASYRARVAYRSRLIPTSTGQVIHERGFVLLDGEPVGPPPKIKNEDKLTLPDGETPPILEAWLVGDDVGVPHHTRVTFG